MDDQKQKLQTSSQSKVVTTAPFVGSAEPARVYISGPLTGVPDLAKVKDFYEEVAAVCRDCGLDPYLPHLHTGTETDHSPQQVFWTDKTTVLESDLVIAYVGHPSLGVGMEVAYAEEYEVPVIFLYEEGITVSRMPRGIPVLFREIVYESHDDALEQLRDALMLFATGRISPRN